MPTKGSGRRVKRKAKLSAAERDQRRIQQSHKRAVRNAFTLTGFRRVAALADKEFTFQASKCDFDDVFVYENIVVVAEYTTIKESEVSGHLKKKKVIFDKISENQSEFTSFLLNFSDEFRSIVSEIYDPAHIKVIIVYCSYNAIKKNSKDEVSCVKYLDYNVVRYLERVAQTIRLSARHEILEFLEVPYQDVGANILQSQDGSTVRYNGSVLPDAHSNFGRGFKVVSFYADPEALLQRAYVLRRDGWRGGENLYQRMISPTKIDQIRSYLVAKERVFINNIIVTMPNETQILGRSGEAIDVEKITKTQPVKVELPNAFNTIGIVDGQHRLFSYFEGGPKDEKISKLRKRQNLLVTGIVFPADMQEEEAARFQATLFLEVNSTQTNARTDLKQEIGVMLRPFEADSITRRVLNHINDDAGPLNGDFEKYFFDKNKLKTTSIVRYALRHLVRIGGEDSLFATWENPAKQDLLSLTNDALLAEYVEYCRCEINRFIGAVKQLIEKERWSANRAVPNRFLTTTNINGLMACMRRLAKSGSMGSHSTYVAALTGIGSFNFQGYKSSQYNVLGERLFQRFFPG